MNENVEIRILVQPRELRAGMTMMRAKSTTRVASARRDIFDQMTDGLPLVLTLLAGRVHAADMRVERLDERLEARLA